MPNATEKEVPVTRLADYTDNVRVAAAQDKYRQLAPRAKKGVLRAATVATPYAGRVASTAVRGAGLARQRLGPRVTLVVCQAREALPPRVEHAVDSVAQRTRSSVRVATDVVPKVGQAVENARATTAPARQEAVARGSAAVAALRGQVTPTDVARARRARARRGQTVKRLAVAGVAFGGACAAWTWWSRRSDQDWLVEAAEATEGVDLDTAGATATAYDSATGTGGLTVPEAQAEQAEQAVVEEVERSARHRSHE